MVTKKGKVKNLCSSISPDLHEELKSFSKGRGIYKSAALQLAIVDFLDTYENNDNIQDILYLGERNESERSAFNNRVKPEIYDRLHSFCNKHSFMICNVLTFAITEYIRKAEEAKKYV